MTSSDQRAPARGVSKSAARSAEYRADDAVPPSDRRLLSILTSAERKEYPVTTGVLDYFPDAIAAVAHISYLGNQKHNPGQDLHWSRGKSADHVDCEARHLIERGAADTEGVRHSAQKAWRALADLQLELEKEYNLSPPRGARDLPPR